jgi:hypothetical protein
MIGRLVMRCLSPARGRRCAYFALVCFFRGAYNHGVYNKATDH